MTITVTIGPDGRLFFNDLTVDLLPVACAVCPQDKTLLLRCQAAENLRKEVNDATG